MTSIKFRIGKPIGNQSHLVNIAEHADNMINSTAVIAADYKVYGSVRLTSLNGPGIWSVASAANIF